MNSNLNLSQMFQSQWNINPKSKVGPQRKILYDNDYARTSTLAELVNHSNHYYQYIQFIAIMQILVIYKENWIQLNVSVCIHYTRTRSIYLTLWARFKVHCKSRTNGVFGWNTNNNHQNIFNNVHIVKQHRLRYIISTEIHTNWYNRDTRFQLTNVSSAYIICGC